MKKVLRHTHPAAIHETAITTFAPEKIYEKKWKKRNTNLLSNFWTFFLFFAIFEFFHL